MEKQPTQHHVILPHGPNSTLREPITVYKTNKEQDVFVKHYAPHLTLTHDLDLGMLGIKLKVSMRYTYILSMKCLDGKRTNNYEVVCKYAEF